MEKDLAQETRIEEDTSPPSARRAVSKPPVVALLVDSLGSDVAATSAAHALRVFDDETKLREALEHEEIDILAMDAQRIAHETVVELTYWCKILDHEPSIVVLLEEADASRILDYYRAGAFRVIVQQGIWQDEYLQALEQAARFKRMEEENTLMHAKLTETNALLQEQNRRLDEFSTSVAHDIRGPLGSIMMRLEFLKDELGEKLAGRSEQVLQRAIDTSQRVIDLVGGIYEFARLGRNSGSEEAIDLTSFIPEVIQDMSFAGDGSVRIELGDLPVVVGRKALLQRVFMNLIANSVKYRDKDEVHIRIYKSHEQFRLQRIFSVVVVEDNGPGIPREYHDSVFQMFSRGQVEFQEGKSKASGLGVGLTAVKRIIEQHYGEISIDPNYSEGLRVLFSLPNQSVELFR